MSRAAWARRGRGIGVARLLAVAPRGPEPRGGGGEGTRRRRDPAPPVLRGRATAWWVELPKRGGPDCGGGGGGTGTGPHTWASSGIDGGETHFSGLEMGTGCELRIRVGAGVTENLLD